MTGLEFIEKLITDVNIHGVRITILFAWNCLLTVGVIVALTRVKDRR
jgi:hypothetical protein